MKQSLSVVLSIHNEKTVLDDALKSVKEIADEIIIVNNESTDNSVKIAKKYTKNILEHKNNPLMLNQAKNYGFSKAKSDWILSLDPDERVTPELAKEITAIISSGIWWPDYQRRLFRRGKGKFLALHNHEFLEVDGDSRYLINPLEHFSYTSIIQYVDKFTYTYLENEVQNQIVAGKKVHWYDAIKMPSSDFVINFFVRQGYKDGLHGLILALLQASYMFLVFARIWERQGQPGYENQRFTDEVTKEWKRSMREYLHWYWLSKN